MTDLERAELNHYRHWLRNDPAGHAAFKRWTLMQAQGDAYCMRCGGSGWDGAVTCQDCKGCGRVHTKPDRPATPQLCPRCVGGIAKVEGGHIVCVHCMGSGLSDGRRTCQACSGRRVVQVDGLNKLCPICSGHGRLPAQPSRERDMRQRIQVVKPLVPCSGCTAMNWAWDSPRNRWKCGTCQLKAGEQQGLLCPVCTGNGHVDGVECLKCNGTGRAERTADQEPAPAEDPDLMTCPVCRGAGVARGIRPGACSNCQGSGQVPATTAQNNDD